MPEVGLRSAMVGVKHFHVHARRHRTHQFITNGAAMQGHFVDVQQSGLAVQFGPLPPKRDFTADERQTLPKSLEEYVNSLKKTG